METQNVFEMCKRILNFFWRKFLEKEDVKMQYLCTLIFLEICYKLEKLCIKYELKKARFP